MAPINPPPPGYPPPGFPPPAGFPPPGGPPPPGWRPGQPAPKKGASGCLVALGITGGVLLLIGLIGGWAIWRAASSPEGKKVFGLVREAGRVGIEATTAPGTAELRKLGCQQAMVMDLASLARTFAGDAGVNLKDEDTALMITCQVGFTGKAPSCAQVASTYVGAVGTAKGRFQVTVQQQLKPAPACTECFDPKGAAIACSRTIGGSRTRRPAPAAPAGDD
ncbi:MAG TPA: hypothetical protein VGQ83_36580 [Polyangia bacterium]|jgi:hypothetical protein